MKPDPSKYLSPDEFTEACKGILANYKGHEAHRMMDALTCELLTALGYGEGVTLFAKGVFDWHHSQLVYPLPRKNRLLCKLGFHDFRADRESDVPWVDPEICIHCNKRTCASLHEICP